MKPVIIIEKDIDFIYQLGSIIRERKEEVFAFESLEQFEQYLQENKDIEEFSLFYNLSSSNESNAEKKLYYLKNKYPKAAITIFDTKKPIPKNITFESLQIPFNEKQIYNMI